MAVDLMQSIEAPRAVFTDSIAARQRPARRSACCVAWVVGYLLWFQILAPGRNLSPYLRSFYSGGLRVFDTDGGKLGETGG